MKQNKKLHVLTWHIHGNYLYYLTQTDCIFYLPVTTIRRAGFWGKTKSFPWGENVVEIPAENVKRTNFDCIIFQSNYNPKNPGYQYLQEQMGILSKDQLRDTPKIFIEHDPPRENPTDTKHPLYNSDVHLVHVTNFNRLMWDSGKTTQHVLPHGVSVPQNARYIGNKTKGIVVINGLPSRGRRLGLDIFQEIKKEIPLDLVGMESENIGGFGEVSPRDLPYFLTNYRFFFHPARYTSLGLAVIEAMAVGLPIVGLSTTELPSVIQNGYNGYTYTNTKDLIKTMKLLLDNKSYAKRLGENARKTAIEKFSIERFAADWKNLIEEVIREKGYNNFIYA